jgi:hypothetical protein
MSTCSDYKKQCEIAEELLGLIYQHLSLLPAEDDQPHLIQERHVSSLMAVNLMLEDAAETLDAMQKIAAIEI